VTNSGENWLTPKMGRAIALVDAESGTTVSYRELSTLVSRRSSDLSCHAGAITFLGVSNDLDSVINVISLISVGATVLLVDRSTPREVLDTWITAYRPDATLGLANLPDRLCSTPTSPRRETLLLPTSGSTGSPKFVRLTLENLRSNAQQISEGLSISPGDKAFGYLPLHYSYGLSILTSHLMVGATVVLSRSSAIRPEFWSQIGKYGVTSLPGVPYSYEMFRRAGFNSRDLPSLREMTQAGGRMRRELIDEFRDEITSRGGKLWLMYGQTEATARISILHPDDLTAHPTSVGTPLKGSRVWVEQPDSTGMGELFLEGPQVMLGYAECREEIDGTDKCGGILPTGDLGYIDSQNRIFITGRQKRIAKLFGIRINLDDIEKKLSKYGNVVAIDGGDKLHLFLEAVEDSKDFHRRAESELSLPARSIQVRVIDNFPTTPSGKIDYQRLYP
jgi:acyl-CoA synthetase (AMP-forming)/AMP-acid ligase II